MTAPRPGPLPDLDAAITPTIAALLDPTAGPAAGQLGLERQEPGGFDAVIIPLIPTSRVRLDADVRHTLGEPDRRTIPSPRPSVTAYQKRCAVLERLPSVPYCLG